MALGPAGTQQPGRSLSESLHLSSQLLPACTVMSRNAKTEGRFARAAFSMAAAETISKSIADTWWHEGELHIPAPALARDLYPSLPLRTVSFHLLEVTNQSTGASVHWGTL